jgi:predicted DNA-binding transcriptional regulator YafY
MNQNITSPSNEEIEQQVKILYTNYKGETSLRTIVPIKIWFGSTDWHPSPQWLINAIDIQKEAERSFAMKDIKAWFLE